jgi:hypothetical protein
LIDITSEILHSEYTTGSNKAKEIVKGEKPLLGNGTVQRL